MKEKQLLTAKDLMTPLDIMVKDDTSISSLRVLLQKKRIGGLPVMNKKREFCGIVTITDVFTSMGIVRNMFMGNKMWIPLFKAGKKKITVKQVYFREKVSVLPDDSIDKVIDLMTAKNLHTLPVMDSKQEKVFGVVGRHDVTWTIFAPEGETQEPDKDYKIYPTR